MGYSTLCRNHVLSLSGRDLAEVFNLAKIDRGKRLNNLMRELLPGNTVVLDQARPPGAIKPGPAQILHTLQGFVSLEKAGATRRRKLAVSS
jgi:hypothetical protein